MEPSFVELNSLPDELLAMIFKKFNSIDIYYSSININMRINKIIYDQIFTTHLTLLQWSADDLIYPIDNAVVDQFCSQMLSKISHQIK